MSLLSPSFFRFTGICATHKPDGRSPSNHVRAGSVPKQPTNGIDECRAVRDSLRNSIRHLKELIAETERLIDEHSHEKDAG